MIVLYEYRLDAVVAERLLVVALIEEPASIHKDARGDDQDAGQSSRFDLHVKEKHLADDFALEHAAIILTGRRFDNCSRISFLTAFGFCNKIGTR